MGPFFTRLYVAGPLALPRLRDVAARALGAQVERDTITTDAASADFCTNDDYDRAGPEVDPTDFIFYPYSVEIEAHPGVSLGRYLETVAAIMTALHRHGATVVASCDWEDVLPGEGKLGAVFVRR